MTVLISVLAKTTARYGVPVLLPKIDSDSLPQTAWTYNQVIAVFLRYSTKLRDGSY